VAVRGTVVSVDTVVYAVELTTTTLVTSRVADVSAVMLMVEYASCVVGTVLYMVKTVGMVEYSVWVVFKELMAVLVV
jgi:hypothetical protein